MRGLLVVSLVVRAGRCWGIGPPAAVWGLAVVSGLVRDVVAVGCRGGRLPLGGVVADGAVPLRGLRRLLALGGFRPVVLGSTFVLGHQVLVLAVGSLVVTPVPSDSSGRALVSIQLRDRS